MNMNSYTFHGRYSRGSKGSAGIDLYAAEDCRIEPQATKVIDVGLTWEVVPGVTVVGIIKDRSSMAAKGLRVGGGVVDPDYEGPIKVVLMNHSFVPYTVSAGDRIAQLIVMPFVSVDDSCVDHERGEGGFGSTGV
jgi:dUTP pyrophosphatase